MRQWTGSTLIRVMACRLFGAKLLCEPVQEYCELDPHEQTAVKSSWKITHLYSMKCIWKCRLWNGGHLVSALIFECCWQNRSRTITYANNYSWPRFLSLVNSSRIQAKNHVCLMCLWCLLTCTVHSWLYLFICIYIFFCKFCLCLHTNIILVIIYIGWLAHSPVGR